MKTDKFAYIISNYKFYKHWDLERAKAEKKRLEALFPEEIFRIYWVRPKINKFGDRMDRFPKEQKSDISPPKKPPRLILKLKKPVKVSA